MVDRTSALELNRRNFLTLCGLGILPGVLLGCTTGQTTQGQGRPTSTPTKTPTPTPTPHPVNPTTADWAALAQELQGSLIRPGDPDYATAHQLFNMRFDDIQPTAVAYCASVADVQHCLAFVRKFGLPIAPRAGGHSYAGYSTTTGLLLDVTRINAVNVDTTANTSVIGAGARLIDIYTILAQNNRLLPGGSCPTVGIAGLTLGGGVGVVGRKFGLTSDNLLSAEVVTADGQLLTCNPQQNADLFWALQGGGGGNFGVVTSFTFKVYPVDALTLFTFTWPWANASAVLNSWQHWAPQAPDELWSNCVFQVTSDKNGEPLVVVNGVYVGQQTAFTPLLAQLTSAIGAAPATQYVWEDTILNTMLYEAGCYKKSVDACHLPTQNPQGQLTRDTFNAKSDYFTTLLPQQGINNLINAIAQCQSDPNLSLGGIGFDAFGGALNRVASSATAFAHRNALFSVQYSTYWNASDPSTIVNANQTWLKNTWQAMRPYASGAAYQNYIDADQPNWQQAYYGANLARLKQIKTKYDPNNLFHFAQSIPLNN